MGKIGRSGKLQNTEHKVKVFFREHIDPYEKDFNNMQMYTDYI